MIAGRSRRAGWSPAPAKTITTAGRRSAVPVAARPNPLRTMPIPPDRTCQVRGSACIRGAVLAPRVDHTRRAAGETGSRAAFGKVRGGHFRRNLGPDFGFLAVSYLYLRDALGLFLRGGRGGFPAGPWSVVAAAVSI